MSLGTVIKDPNKQRWYIFVCLGIGLTFIWNSTLKFHAIITIFVKIILLEWNISSGKVFKDKESSETQGVKNG